MAEGVENAACILCFIDQAYQDSANCQSELKFAKQCGVPLVPIMMESNWRATGWLGIVLAGALWCPLQEQSFDADIDKLVSQIRQAVPNSTSFDHGNSTSFDDEIVGISRHELREEFARLRADVESSHAVEFHLDTNAPAALHVGVPKLPSDLRETECIRYIREVLLRKGDPTEYAKMRVGFCEPPALSLAMSII